MLKKKMLKRVIIVGLTLMLLLNLIACNNKKNDETWILLREYDQSPDGTITIDINYNYDAQGRLIVETHSGSLGDYEFINFQHDENGNVISKTEKYNDDFGNTKYVYFSYVYNIDNEIEKETITYSDSDNKKEITYEYDDHKNIILSNRKEYRDGKEYSRIDDFYLTDENENFLQYEVKITDSILDTFYALKEIYYDENGNKTVVKTYGSSDYTENIGNVKIVNGKKYYNLKTTHFVYKKLNEVTTEEAELSSTEDNKEEVEVKLSDSCDKIIYSLKDEADYYEFVVNEEIEYPKTTYKVGVIKNNEWLVEMSKQSPLLNDDNSWKSLKGVNSNPLDKIHFKYLGEGCFLYYVDHFTANINNSGIIYNPSKNVFFPVQNMSYYDNFDNIVKKGIIVVMNQFYEWVSLDTNTGKTSIINGYFKKGGEWSVERLQGQSEGLFMAHIEDFGFTTKYITGFFDFNGDLIVDLGEYGYPDKNNDYRFYNGQCKITTKNDTGVKFNITIDKSGKIISQEKID